MSEPYVFHFVANHDGKDVERLGTLVLRPEAIMRIGPVAAARGVEIERKRWTKLLLAQYGPGWVARVVKERGFVRSLYPGAALRASPGGTGLIAVSGQGGIKP